MPKEVCDELNIVPGDYVKVYVENGKVIVERILSLNELAGILNPGYQVKNLAEELDRERKVGGRK